jgi:hypothetical protein
VKTKPCIVLRVGQSPVVEQLECEDVERWPGQPTVSAVKLESLYAITGGMVDFTTPIPEEVAKLEQQLGVKLASGEPGFIVVMAVHDEGMVRNFPVNELATSLYKNRHVYAIHGDCVLVEVD